MTETDREAALHWKARAEHAEKRVTELEQQHEAQRERIRIVVDWLDKANELGNRMTIGLARAAEERDAALARIDDVRHVLDAHAPGGRHSAGYDLWSDVDAALAE